MSETQAALLAAAEEAIGTLFYQNALKVSCDTVCHSYGIWNEVLPNLTTIESIRLQKTNRFFYDIAMSRSQTKLQLGWVRFLFTDTSLMDNTLL